MALLIYFDCSMRHCGLAVPAPRYTLLFLLAAGATSKACTFYTHERSILSSLPFSRFTIDDSDPSGDVQQLLLKCAQHAAAFEVSAASLGMSSAITANE